MRPRAVLDDQDSRPGSATSLLRTLVGCYLRRLGGWLPGPALLRLMGDLGVSAPQARTALLRVRRKGVLVPAERDGHPGYALSPAAVPMLERGDRRIFQPPTMGPDDPWCLVSFSIPEAQRDRRHQLRRMLTWTGCGLVSAGLWIAPGYRAGEVEEILADLGLSDAGTVFLATEVRLPGGPREAAARWWDLPQIAARHQAFLDVTQGAALPGDDPAAAFTGWLTALDVWRVVPYLDPGLPPDWLPPDWPGPLSAARFGALRDRWQEAGLAHARQVAGL